LYAKQKVAGTKSLAKNLPFSFTNSKTAEFCQIWAPFTKSVPRLHKCRLPVNVSQSKINSWRVVF